MAANKSKKVKESGWLKEKIFMGQDFGKYFKGLFTPVNIISAIFMIAGLVLVIIRFATGLGSVAHPSQYQPWGLFLSWGLFSGIPIAGAAFVFGALVHIFKLEKYKPYVKNALLIGVIGYISAAVFLLLDLGRPWRIYHPLVISFGLSSVLFIIAWTMVLHIIAETVEFLPSVWLWLGKIKAFRWNKKLCLGLAIFIATISIVHQSALGALYLIVPEKLHPLWHSPLLPLLFFIASVIAGLSIVVIASLINKRFFNRYADSYYLDNINRISLSIGRIVSYLLGGYLVLKIVALVMAGPWGYLLSGYGLTYLIEVFGFCVLPLILLIQGIRNRGYRLIHVSLAIIVVGILFNRMNISWFALNWQVPEKEYFSFLEFIIILGMISAQFSIYRWIVKRMPVIRTAPEELQ